MLTQIRLPLLVLLYGCDVGEGIFIHDAVIGLAMQTLSWTNVFL